MSSPDHAPNASEYIVHHLAHLNTKAQGAIIDSAESRRFVAPLAMTVFVWITLMNSLDLLPVDLPNKIFAWTGLDGLIQYNRIVPTADLNGTFGMALGVLLLILYYNVKIKHLGGFIHELFCAPFGNKIWLYPFNPLLNLIP